MGQTTDHSHRPDVVTVASRVCSHATRADWCVVIRILRYMLSTCELVTKIQYTQIHTHVTEKLNNTHTHSGHEKQLVLSHALTSQKKLTYIHILYVDLVCSCTHVTKNLIFIHILHVDLVSDALTYTPGDF